MGLSRLLRARRGHLVLNSLSGDFIAASAALLGEGGAFEERGAWSGARVAAAGAHDMAAEVPRDPLWYRRCVLRTLARRAGGAEIGAGMPLHCFDLARDAHAAFRLLQSGRNLGKVVLRVALQRTGAGRGTDFARLTARLAAHTDASVHALDAAALGRAYDFLEQLCQQYVRAAAVAVRGRPVPRGHHRLLVSWCEAQPVSSSEARPPLTPDDVCAAHADLWPEAALAARCGPRLADALTGAVPYQELLFPGGSMDTVRPVYQDSVIASFYNECVVAAVRAIVGALPAARRLRVLEIGAGTGGTAASVLPALRHACSCYTFTDVSDAFLRAARPVFAAEFPFVEYELLNVDADPRLQGFASHQCVHCHPATPAPTPTPTHAHAYWCPLLTSFAVSNHRGGAGRESGAAKASPSLPASTIPPTSLRRYDLIISTNCLHATPFMRTTLRHCRQLLVPSGLLLVNDAQRTGAFLQLTFGLTDGWWLFDACGDPERAGYPSPLMNWTQWQVLLAASGFGSTHCMRGGGFLQGQAVMVAQAGSAASTSEGAGSDGDAAASAASPHRSWGDGSHVLTGGLGGLGLLTARLLVERGAAQLLLSSRSGRVQQGSEADWGWLAGCGAVVRCVRNDVSDALDVGAIFRTLHGDGWRLGGVYHAAGVLDDALLAGLSADRFATVFGPKTCGAPPCHARSHAPACLGAQPRLPAGWM